MWFLITSLAAFLVLGQGQTVVEVDVTESKAFLYTMTETKIETCLVTLPNGNIHELLPNKTIITEVDERYTVSSKANGRTCGLSIDSTTFSDSGTYLLDITGTNGSSYQNTYILRVQERTDIWPSSTIEVIASETVYIFLPNTGRTVQTCILKPPGSGEVEVKFGESVNSFIKQWSPNSDAWCGVEIRNATEVGSWKLSAAVNATHWYYTKTLVQVEDFSILADTWVVITPVVGETLSDSIGHENASYCQLKDPQGEIAQVVAGRCSFNLSVVTSQHNGTWIASTGLKGSPTEVVEIIELDVQEIPYIYAASNGNKVTMGAIDLYCRVHDTVSEVCRFVSPTGLGVSMVLGVGNEKYAPYFDPDGLYTCGLTIRQLSSDDYGTWTCYTGNSSDIRIGYISVIASESEEVDIVSRAARASTAAMSVSDSYTAYSVYNESLTLSCSALATLTYCWFKHPNGSYYSASPDVSDNNLYTYSGSGLTLGSCAITFTHSTYDDAGTWTCNMGIEEREIDVSVNITVKVAPSALTVLSVKEIGGVATVQCAVLDTAKALSYCRFIRPDGVGINAMYANHDSKYSLTGDLAQGTCKLIISNVQAIDIGNWVCAGKLQIVGPELSDTFKISSAPRLGLSVFLIAAPIIRIIIT